MYNKKPNYLIEMTKLSVNKTKWTSLLSRTRALILLDFDLNISFRQPGFVLRNQYAISMLPLASISKRG